MTKTASAALFRRSAEAIAARARVRAEHDVLRERRHALRDRSIQLMRELAAAATAFCDALAERAPR